MKCTAKIINTIGYIFLINLNLMRELNLHIILKLNQYLSVLILRSFGSPIITMIIHLNFNILIIIKKWVYFCFYFVLLLIIFISYIIILLDCYIQQFYHKIITCIVKWSLSSPTTCFKWEEEEAARGFGGMLSTLILLAFKKIMKPRHLQSPGKWFNIIIVHIKFDTHYKRWFDLC